MARPKKYPDELVARGVRLALESGRPIAHVAADLGMHPETLRKKVRQAQADSGGRPDLPSSQEREEIRALRREVFELRRANEILKVLDDHQVLGSIGSVGDAYDNSMAESFVDSFKTELIADRVWRTRSQLELAIVEWVGWFNHARLHESLDDIPPAEFEALYAPRFEPITHTMIKETN
jgi:transposase-like protein